MPGFKIRDLKPDLLLPRNNKVTHHIRKLDELPGNYDSLPFLEERTDLINPTGRLEVQDRVYFIIPRVDYHEFYEICCLRR